MLYFHCFNKHGLQAITPDCILAGGFASGPAADEKGLKYCNEQGCEISSDEISQEPTYVKFDYHTTQHRKLGSDHKAWLDWRDSIENYWLTR